MSVIIRLQNLAWSANALDIRQFFRGLSIPEGGVHIVGGELGDAFIAFRYKHKKKERKRAEKKFSPIVISVPMGLLEKIFLLHPLRDSISPRI